MGMFEQFPYTNFHELNLDTLAKIVGDLKINIDGILDEAKAYTDEIKQEVDEELAAQIETVNTLISDAQDQFDAQILMITGLLDDYLDQSKSYTDGEVANLRTYVDNELANVGVNVIDPVTGVYGSVQNAIYSLYGLHTGDTLTATEYDTLAMTATAYDGKQLTASDYDLYGKNLLP